MNFCSAGGFAMPCFQGGLRKNILTGIVCAGILAGAQETAADPGAVGHVSANVVSDVASMSDAGTLTGPTPAMIVYDSATNTLWVHY